MKILNWSYVILSLITCYMLFTSGIGNYSIYILDEAKNAECAREMMVSGDIFVPTFNNELRTDKPPLHYFFIIAGYKLFGVNSFGARFFSGLFGVFTLLITFLFTRKFTDLKTATYTFLVLISSIHFLLEFHLAVPDPYLIFFITASLMAFYCYFETSKIIYLFLCYFAMALGILTKGPIAILVPGLIILTFLLVQKIPLLTILTLLKPWYAGLIVIIIALPWYLNAHISTDGMWTSEFFLKHNVQRFTGSMEGHGGAFWMTPLFIIVGMLPFSLFLIPALKEFIKNRNNNVITYAIISFGIFLLFFSISKTKLPNYILPAYPFIAIIIANYLKKISSYPLKNIGTFLLINMIIQLALSIVFYVVMEDMGLNKTSIKYVTLLLIILPIGALSGFYFGMTKRWEAMISTYTYSWILMSIVIFRGIFPILDKTNPVAKSAYLFNSQSTIAYYKRINPAFLFHHQQTFHKLNNPAELTHFLKNNSSPLVISELSYEQEIITNSKIKTLFQAPDLFESTSTIILGN